MNKLKLCEQSVEHIKEENSQEFPDSPVVRTQHFHCKGLGSTPGQEPKILEATEHSQEKKNKNSLHLDPCVTTGEMIYAPNQGQNGGAPPAPPLKQGLLVPKASQVLLPLISVLTFIQQSLLALTSSACTYFWLSPEAFRTWLYKQPLQLPAKGLRKSL